MSNAFDEYFSQGLTSAQVGERLKKEGLNELPSSKPRNLFAIAAGVMKEPMIFLLVMCGIFYLLLGDINEALLLLSFVLVVAGITLYQEKKTETALYALRELSSPRAMVVRDGRQIRIAGHYVVRGDIMILSEGDRVPADAQLLYCSNFQVDESILTGESVPVKKSVSSQDLQNVFSGTLVVRGRGIAKVYSTGINTEIGKIGKSLERIKTEKTPLQKETSGLVMHLAAIGAALFGLMVLIFGVVKNNWMQGILAGITLSMSILPEEFPVILTIFLALGAWRIAKKNVLTRRIPIIETLGSATVLCVDKTGTLTLNQMSVNSLVCDGLFFDLEANVNSLLPEKFHELVEYSILASQNDPIDPMEKAIRNLGKEKLEDTSHLHDGWEIMREYPLSEKMMALSHVYKDPLKDSFIIAAKGAPEAIADLCHMDDLQEQKLLENIEAMAEKGLRVLGVAKAEFNKSNLPDEQHVFNFQFLGLIGLSDPVRKTVPDAISECYRAGIRVVMITGDYPATAKNIAHQIGLKDSDYLITGQELEQMDDEEIRSCINVCNIFSRVIPEQKLKIVNALKANGEIVAMTGDGVNDAPALKAAHIGIAMGQRGTDVAREASSLVLLDDDFSSIVKAVRMGRRIFDNIKKAFAYTLAVHVPIAGLAFFPILLRWPLILLPIHVVFLELIIDPACSIVFEAEEEEKNIMLKPPRNPATGILGKNMVVFGLFQGLSVLFMITLTLITTKYFGLSEGELRAFAFTILIVSNVGLIMTNRSWTRSLIYILRSQNKAFWWLIAGVTLFMLAILTNPFLKELFHFETLHLNDFLICFAAGVISIIWFEVLKIFSRKLI